MGNNSFSGNILRGVGMRIRRWQQRPAAKVNIGPLKKIYFKHLIPDRQRTHLFLGKSLSYVRATEMMHGLEEIFIEEIYKQPFSAQPYIIDCGANIGLSVLYLKLLSPGARVLAFEPDEENFRLLEKNVATYGLTGVTLKKEAVWTKDETLHFSGGGSMASRITDARNNNSVEVKAVRLKDFLTEPVDFLKIDIEGAEYDVVMDIIDKLHWVNRLFLEYHGSFEHNLRLLEMLKLVTQQGFSYYIKEGASVYPLPFEHSSVGKPDFDIQLNIFFFRDVNNPTA